MSKPKLIIHETDCHGSGKFYYNGKWDYYSYDDEYGVRDVHNEPCAHAESL